MLAAERIRLFHGSPLETLSSCLRGAIVAGGNELIVADFSNIESRVLAWLAGEAWKLDVFRKYDRKEGPDVYVAGYARTFDVQPETVDDYKRQVGKVIELALGFGGGAGALETMGKTYKVKMTDEQKDTAKTLWREAHPATKAYWYDLEDAATAAVLAPGRTTSARATRYRVSGSFLWCLLPSGRALCYPYPKIMPVSTPWGEMKDSVTYMTVIDQQQKLRGKVIEDPAGFGDWQRVSTYGGKLAENVTQAVARDLLKNGMKNVEAAGYPVVLHVHDEIVAEVPAGWGDVKEFERLCCALPPWAGDLPIAAKGWRGIRYRKD